MIILGKTNDDKGTQLENLTREILEKMNCRNVEVNFVSSGGEEIDVIADFPLPNIGSAQFRRFVCECKAYARPIDMPHWLKFLGKIYSEEARLNSEVSGCFIALSGVNGNVSGHYDQLKLSRPNISLVKGENLSDELKKIYRLCDAEKVSEVLEQFTNRRYRTLEIAYYERAVYWVVVFEDDAYTILDAEGNEVPAARLDELKEMVEAALSAEHYVVLAQEAAAHERSVQVKKSVVFQLIKNNGRIKKTDLTSGETVNFTEAEFEAAISDLNEQGWINISEDKNVISFLPEDNAIFYTTLRAIYHFQLGGRAGFDLVGMLKSDFYRSHINERFVAEIRRVQGGLPLSEADVQSAIKILKLSPSAVLWSIQPDQMIITHRSDSDFKVDEAMDAFDRNYFFQQLSRSLRFDINHPIAREYILDFCEIREIETDQKITIKSNSGIEMESALHERLGIGRLVDDLIGPDGSNIVLMSLMKNAPEPWEKQQ